MTSFSRNQWVAIGVTLVLFIMLFFINRSPTSSTPAGDTGKKPGNEVSGGIAMLLAKEWQGFNSKEKKRETVLEDSLHSASASVERRIIKLLIKFNDSAGNPVHSLYYTESLAALDNNTRQWYIAGKKYYNDGLTADSIKSPVLLKRAQKCYEKALELDSNNLDAKVGIGQCIVESGENPMKGIGMIEDVIKKDSNNVNGYIALGVFSIKSGQYAKAINRFKKVLQMEPSFGDAYLYIAQAYDGLGDKKQTIVNLKKYIIFAPDTIIKTEVSNYINELQKR